MKIRIRENGEIITDDVFRAQHENVSFPATLTPEILNDFKADEVWSSPQPPYDPDTQYVVFDGAEEVDGKWYEKWAIENYTPEQIAQRLAQWRAQTSCTPFQGRMALSDANLLANAQAIVDAADEKTKVAWEYALIWERTSPMIASLAQALGLSDTEVDSLFKAAQEIQA